MGLFSFLTGAGPSQVDPGMSIPANPNPVPRDPGMSAEPGHGGLLAALFDHPVVNPGKTTTYSTEGLPSDSIAVRQNGPTMDLQGPPQVGTEPGLLHKLASYAFSPEGLMMLGTALRASGGDDRAWADQANMQKTRLQMAQYQRQLALQQRGNQAFRAAYQNGKFDPNVYAQVMGDALDPDALAKLSTTFNPKQAIQDGYIVQNDPITGTVKILGQRPMTYSEQTAADSLKETSRHNTVEEGQGSARIAEEARHNRVGEGLSAGQLGVSQAHLGLDAAGQAFERQKFGATQNPGVPVITNPADRAKLPPGAAYIAPDGSLRHKQ